MTEGKTLSEKREREKDSKKVRDVRDTDKDIEKCRKKVSDI